VVRAGLAVVAMEQIERAGFEIVHSLIMKPPRATMESFYEEHRGQPFFEPLVDFMCSGNAIALALRRENAVRLWREAIGPTDPDQAVAEAPTSFRARFGTSLRHNAVHGSDSADSAKRELKLVFDDSVRFNE
jgi:nucleoside-diphosphate kinase